MTTREKLGSALLPPWRCRRVSVAERAEARGRGSVAECSFLCDGRQDDGQHRRTWACLREGLSFGGDALVPPGSPSPKRSTSRPFGGFRMESPQRKVGTWSRERWQCRFFGWNRTEWERPKPPESLELLIERELLECRHPELWSRSQGA
jgi:hypothetical protein